ncbi:MAG: CapA family protein, partial [Anaerolineae bacterium]|nr:CapA family protein [Anaerolineae bacterium]
MNDTISTAGYAYPWGDVLDLLKHTDMNIINLETTLTNSTKAVPKVFHFKADPDRIQTLREARIDVCNLANNHILDYSAEGLIETVSVLDAAGIEHVGAGLNAAHAARPVIIM